MPLYCDCTCYKISSFFLIFNLVACYCIMITAIIRLISCWVQVFKDVPKSYHNITNFMYFLSNLFLPCKNTFTNDLKYDTCQI